MMCCSKDKLISWQVSCFEDIVKNRQKYQTLFLIRNPDLISGNSIKTRQMILSVQIAGLSIFFSHLNCRLHISLFYLLTALPSSDVVRSAGIAATVAHPIAIITALARWSRNSVRWITTRITTIVLTATSTHLAVL